MDRVDHIRQAAHTLYAARNADKDPWTTWGYDNHVLVVARLAEQYAVKFGANVEHCVVGALLHDIADAVMLRKNPAHSEESLRMAHALLADAGYAKTEATHIVDEVIKPHSCNDLLPTTLEGKVVATADGAAHFVTDFYLYFCWQHFGPKDDYAVYKQWVTEKIEKHYHRKLFFAEVQSELKPRYDAVRLMLGAA